MPTHLLLIFLNISSNKLLVGLLAAAKAAKPMRQKTGCCTFPLTSKRRVQTRDGLPAAAPFATLLPPHP